MSTSSRSIQRILKPLPRGYRWVCTFDPNGIFTGFIFRKQDIEVWNPNDPEVEEENWAEGLLFQHVSRPVRATVINGQLSTLGR